MNKWFIAIVLFLLSLTSQAQHLISGYVQDVQSAERLVGANVFIPHTNKGTTTNNFGYFSLNVSTDTCKLQIQHLGYQTQQININFKSDSLLIIQLKPGITLDEVAIYGTTQNQNREFSDLNYTQLNQKQITNFPAFLGETDVTKALQYQPGVSGGRENSAGFNVRGGSADQNLILLDGAPVYNMYHAMGFFSTFNTYAIKDATFYKGGIPAKYGGRLSSVLDITTREGNMREFDGVFSVGLISAQATIEAPIKQDKASFLLSFRRSYLDLPVRLALKLTNNESQVGYMLYDLNLKTNWIVNNNNRLYLSFYSGRDTQFYNYAQKFSNFYSDNDYHWGNYTGVLRWNHIFNSKIFANFSAYGSYFENQTSSIINDDGDFATFRSRSNLKDYSLKSDFEYQHSSNYSLLFGSLVSHLQFAPGISYSETKDYSSTLNSDNKNNAMLAEMYAENKLNFNQLFLNIGGRISNYNYNNYSKWHFQPRFSAILKLKNDYAISASYMYTTQYLHFLSSSSMGMPSDLWVGSSNRVKPEISQQVSLGIEKNISTYIKLGIESYYKHTENVIRFKQGMGFSDGSEIYWEDAVVSGKGNSYGLELYAQKNTGRFTGMLSYTLSKSERLFDGLNNNDWFPFKFDRTHDFSINGKYPLRAPKDKTRSLSFSFILQSGNYYSIPDIEQENWLLPGMENTDYNDSNWWDDYFATDKNYANPNNFQMPLFHHLDLGYESTKQLKKGRSRTWSLSVYNVYNRQNPWTYYKREGQFMQLSIFPIIPSFSYIYRW